MYCTDNHMINGTKLLNVAGMTRGRRDGILKSEKQKHVVKIGPMHLKGVWYVLAPSLLFTSLGLETDNALQDPVRTSPRVRQQGENHGDALPSLRPQHRSPTLPSHKPWVPSRSPDPKKPGTSITTAWIG